MAETWTIRAVCFDVTKELKDTCSKEIAAKQTKKVNYSFCYSFYAPHTYRLDDKKKRKINNFEK